MNRQARSGAGKRKIVVRNLITEEENGPGQLTGGARPRARAPLVDVAKRSEH